MNYQRQLTLQDKTLIQAVTDINMTGKGAMYGDINKKIEGKIRITDANRKRLAVLVKEDYLILQGKRYFNPLLQEPKKDHPTEVVASAEEMIQHCKDHALMFFILSLRTNDPNELPTIIKYFKDEGLTRPVIRRLELIVAVLSVLMRDYKSLPELDLPGIGNMVGSNVIDDIYRLIKIAE